MSASAVLPDVTIDGERLLTVLGELAMIGADERGGVTRPGFSEADGQGRAYIAERAVDAGLVPRIDPAGNLIVGRRCHRDRPALLMGSHLDTVINGGALDGAYGVVAALEVLSVIAAAGLTLRYEPVVVAFANEEGARFPCPFLGSLALAGQLEPSVVELTDAQGCSLRTALRSAGGDPERLAAAGWPAGSIGAYLELHIEQGPVLERVGVPIGIVTAITGRSVIDIHVTGGAGHAGTLPMADRVDALVAATHVVQAVEDMAKRRRLCAVATVGMLRVDPGAPNVVPGAVRLTAELRDSRQDRLDAAEQALVAALAGIEACTGARVRTRVTDRIAPVGTDPALRAVIADAAAELGYATRELDSGAGHDAQIVARVAPTAMIFVPSRGGVSHVPHESTADGHLVAGAQVLLGAVLRAAAPVASGAP